MNGDDSSLCSPAWPLAGLGWTSDDARGWEYSVGTVFSRSHLKAIERFVNYRHEAWSTVGISCKLRLAVRTSTGTLLVLRRFLTGGTHGQTDITNNIHWRPQRAVSGCQSQPSDTDRRSRTRHAGRHQQRTASWLRLFNRRDFQLNKHETVARHLRQAGGTAAAQDGLLPSGITCTPIPPHAPLSHLRLLHCWSGVAGAASWDKHHRLLRALPGHAHRLDPLRPSAVTQTDLYQASGAEQTVDPGFPQFMLPRLHFERFSY